MQRNRGDPKETQSLINIAMDSTEWPDRASFWLWFIMSRKAVTWPIIHLFMLCSFCHGDLFARRHTVIFTLSFFIQSCSLYCDGLSRQLCLPVKLATMTCKYFCAVKLHSLGLSNANFWCFFLRFLLRFEGIQVIRNIQGRTEKNCEFLRYSWNS